MPDGICPFANYVPISPDVYTKGGEPKVGFCDHTAGGFYTTLADPGFWKRQGYSVHFGIGRKGEIVQLVNIFDTAWAQGRDSRGQEVGPTSPGVSWLPFDQMGKRNPNSYLISTEHEDYVLVNGVARAVPDSQWTPVEYDADLRVKRWCVEEFRRVKGVNLMPFGIDSLASHHMFDPVNRAYCAGKFWRNEYRARLYKDLTGGNDMMIRHNAVAPSMDDTQLDNSTAGIPLTAFQPALPDNLALLRVEVYATQGNRTVEPEIRVLDGDGTSYAGQCGWGRGDQDIYGIVDVKVQNGRFHLQGTGTVKRIGCVGYFV